MQEQISFNHQKCYGLAYCLWIKSYSRDLNTDFTLVNCYYGIGFVHVCNIDFQGTRVSA